MNIDLSEEQAMLRASARDFLQKEMPKSLVRELEESELGYSPDIWRKMAELGWMGIVIPDEYGGMGWSFLDLVVLLEEMGRNIVPGPFLSTTVLGSLSIVLAGNEEQKKEFLPPIANGDMIIAFALTEPSASYDPSEITLSASAKDNGYVISGTKLFIEYAHIADYILCVARTKKGATPEDGITLFLVDAKSAGITCTLFDTIASDKQCEVIFDNVIVPENSIVGEKDKGWPIVEKILGYGAVARCAEMVGGARQAVDMVVAYVKERIVYEHPLSHYQAVQHACVDAHNDAELMRIITYKVAWALSEGIASRLEVAAAKAWVGEAYTRVTKAVCILHGAIGVTRDHDAGLYYRRAKAAEIALGNADYQREKVAQELGL